MAAQHPRVGLGPRSRLQGRLRSRKECGRSLRLGRVSSGPAPALPGLSSRAPQIWLPGFGCLAPGSCSPGLQGDTWPPGLSCTLGRGRPLWRGPARTPGPSAPSGVRVPPLPSSAPQLWGEAERGAPVSGRGQGWPSADLSHALPSESGARLGRALGPRGRGSAPSSGRGRAGWAGLRPTVGAARSRERGPSVARAVGPPRARPRSPVPARHARLRLQVPGEAQAAAAVPAVREAHAGARAGVYLRPPLLRHLPAGVPQVRPGRRGGVRGTAWGGARLGGTPGLCLRLGPVTSRAAAVTSRGGDDVRPAGRTPRADP